MFGLIESSLSIRNVSCHLSVHQNPKFAIHWLSPDSAHGWINRVLGNNSEPSYRFGWGPSRGAFGLTVYSSYFCPAVRGFYPGPTTFLFLVCLASSAPSPATIHGRTIITHNMNQCIDYLSKVTCHLIAPYSAGETAAHCEGLESAEKQLEWRN